MRVSIAGPNEFGKGGGQPWGGSFSAYSCRLDPKTGRILEKVFTK